MSDIPAGWQPDPRGRHEYRYWDGSQWTDHVSDQGTVSQDPVADTSPPAAAETPATEVQPAAVTPEPEPEPVVAEPEPVAAEPAAVTPTDHDVSDPGITLAAEDREPVAASTPPAGSASPPGGTTTPSTQATEAKTAAQEALHSKNPDLATILSVIAPGSGHFYLGAGNAVPIGAALLGATLVGVILSYFSFLLFIVGFVIIVASAVYALMDLRGGPQAVLSVNVPPNIVGILLIAAGAIMLISLFLPFFHVKIDAGAFGSAGGNVSAWDAFEILRFVWLIVALAAIVAGAASLGLGPVTAAELPPQLPMAVAIGGAVAAVTVLFRLFVDGVPDVGDVSIGRAFGAYLLLDASLIIVLSNLGLLRSLSNKDHQAV